MSLKNFLATSLLFALTLPSVVNAANLRPLQHEHNGQHPQQLELNAGKKWQTDIALRKGMAAIHLQLADAMPAIHQGKFSPIELQKLASGIEVQVAGIVSNCKLDAKADAQLHLVITQILEGSKQLVGKQPTTSPYQGVMTVLSALDSYLRYFDDPELAHLLQH